MVVIDVSQPDVDPTDVGPASVEIADISVAYREGGSLDGPPLVLVHGLAEDSQTWQRQLDEFDGFHLYAYDLRGHGATTVGNADGTLAQLSNDLCRFVDTVSGPAACVGFSLGGAVVLAAAMERPDLVTAAIVLATSTVVGRGAASYYRERIARAKANEPGEVAQALREDTVAGLHGANHDVDAITAARVAAVGDGRGYASATQAMLALNAAPLTPRLGEVRCAVTVIGGEFDTFCPRRAAEIILAGLPQARYIEIPAAGHLLNIDNPAAVSAALTMALTGAS